MDRNLSINFLKQDKENGKMQNVSNNFCSTIDTFKKVKSQATDWEKIFTIHIPEKRVIKIV